MPEQTHDPVQHEICNVDGAKSSVQVIHKNEKMYAASDLMQQYLSLGVISFFNEQSQQYKTNLHMKYQQQKVIKSPRS